MTCDQLLIALILVNITCDQLHRLAIGHAVASMLVGLGVARRSKDCATTFPLPLFDRLAIEHAVASMLVGLGVARRS